MKKTGFIRLAIRKRKNIVLNYGQLSGIAIKFRLKIDTLSELHDQLIHHEYKENKTFCSTKQSLFVRLL